MSHKQLYKSAVEWVAINDESINTDLYVLGHPILIALIADVFEIDHEKVINDVERERAELRKPINKRGCNDTIH